MVIKFDLSTKRKAEMNYLNKYLFGRFLVTALLFSASFCPTLAQTVPSLGAAQSFTLYTINGAVTNTGVSNITGNIGSNNGLITGFGTSTVIGTTYAADATTAQCAIDLMTAFNQLDTTSPTATHIPVLGNGESLYAGVYSIAAAGSVAAGLTLDAQGDSNAIFIFKIGAAFTTAAASTVSLINGASAGNVFWIAEGAISMGAATTMQGTLISNNAAISIGAGSTLTGRMFSTNGAVNLDALSASVLLPVPAGVYKQSPNIGSLASFVLFTVTGAVENTGISVIKGNIGANTGSITGFGPGNLTGNIYNADAVTARCSRDLLAMYHQLDTTVPTSTHLPVLGNGETLYAGVYSLAAAGSVASVLNLDAQGDPDAVFVFKVGGALSTGASTTVNLIDGASACNVFWVAEGAISMAASTTMKGTLIANNGAISMGASGMLEGRMFSTTGAASFYGVSASIPMGCSVASSWTGAAGTADWFTPGNWSRVVPDAFVEALIPTTLLAGRVFPIINTGIATVDTVTIEIAASITVSGSTFQVNGAIVNNGVLNASNGTIEMIGFSSQTLAANTFQNNAVNHLIVSNRSLEGVILGGALDIYGSLSYSDTSMKLTTNDTLTLKSTALNTATIGVMTGNIISGKVTVERYIAAHRAWQFLSVPTNTTQTVNQAWQEGAVSISSNPVPGYGTQITCPGGTTAGFDIYTAAPSMKTYNPANNGWVGIANTSPLSIKGTNGYMIFIRGDRAANALNSPSTQTVLRTKGSLYTGDQAPIPVSAGKFASIGNPYASLLDMRNITKTGLKDFFYVWDPNLGGSNGYGGYQIFSNNGVDYVITPGLGSYGAVGSAYNYLRSGQAFLVQGDSLGGTITLKEAAKINSGGQVSIAARSPQPQLRTGLYGVNANNSIYMIDGVLINYDDSYSNNVDDMDALKSTNTSENLSIKKAGTFLIIERRHSIAEKDTIFLNLANTKVQKYRFEFTTDQLGQPGLTGSLEDTYLHTSTLLNLTGSTIVDFNILNIPGSRATNRFRIVFTPAMVLPLSFTSIKAYQENKDIVVEWAAENEINTRQYEVERSNNGIQFTNLCVTKATGNDVHFANYQVTDTHPLQGYNYYRVKSLDANNRAGYTNIVKVLMEKRSQTISIYPNPLANGIIYLHLTNEPEGIYGIRLLNKLGQVIISKQIDHAEGCSIETIRIDKYTRHGVYQLKVTGPGGIKADMKVIY
jgi:hypothetical protein